MKILLADDDVVTRVHVQSLLGRAGYEVVEAADGNEAWRALQEPGAPRLALLDWVMPGRTGPELCRSARAAPALRGVYLILLTGKTSRGDVLEGLRAGANDHICKPFDPEE